MTSILGGPGGSGGDPDMTFSDDRYVRMPVKVLWILAAGLCVAVWAYFNLLSLATEAKTIGVSNQQSLSLVVVDVNTIKQTQAIQAQKTNDFIDSSERLFNRYFRDINDRDRGRTQ